MPQTPRPRVLMCYKGTAEQAAEPLSRAGLDVLTPAPPPGPPPSHRLIHDAEEMGQLGELGVLFLLFEMGLELSLDRLKVRRVHTWGGGAQCWVRVCTVRVCARPACSLSGHGQSDRAMPNMRTW